MVKKAIQLPGLCPFILRGHVFPMTDQGRKLAKKARLELVGTWHGDGIFRCPQPEIKAPAEMWDTSEEIFAFRAAQQARPDRQTIHELAGIVRSRLDELIRRAKRGEEKALWKFAQIVIESLETLNSIAKKTPSLLEPLARNLCAWPVMMSNHPHLCDKTDWLSGLGLGKSSVIQLDKWSKWHPDEAASIAIQLLRYIQENQFSLEVLCLFGGVVPKLSQDSWKKWWHVARAVLLATYPNPENIAELKGIVKPAKPAKSRELGPRKTPSKLSTPGRLRQAIFEQLKAKFKAFAKESPAKQPTKLSLSEIRANVKRMRARIEQIKKVT